MSKLVKFREIRSNSKSETEIKFSFNCKASTYREAVIPKISCPALKMAALGIEYKTSTAVGRPANYLVRMCHSRILSPSKASEPPILFPHHVRRAEMFARSAVRLK